MVLQKEDVSGCRSCLWKKKIKFMDRAAFPRSFTYGTRVYPSKSRYLSSLLRAIYHQGLYVSSSMGIPCTVVTYILNTTKSAEFPENNFHTGIRVRCCRDYQIRCGAYRFYFGTEIDFDIGMHVRCCCRYQIRWGAYYLYFSNNSNFTNSNNSVRLYSSISLMRSGIDIQRSECRALIVPMRYEEFQ